ncbi:hypothetical protein ACS0TY_030982 [Phlomoides rotata]
MSGRWKVEEVTINLVNIYASCEVKDQQELWGEVQGWIKDKNQESWCVCGYFNAILHPSERKGRGRFINHTGCRQFRSFIEEAELTDLPLLRRKFTWYKDNGASCSRLDRFLILAKWCARWPNAKQSGLKRIFSDHAPIILESCQRENWGPIPF